VEKYSKRWWVSLLLSRYVLNEQRVLTSLVVMVLISDVMRVERAVFDR